MEDQSLRRKQHLVQGRLQDLQGSRVLTDPLHSRVVPSERIGLPSLGEVRIDAQELVGGRIVVAPN